MLKEEDYIFFSLYFYTYFLECRQQQERATVMIAVSVILCTLCATSVRMLLYYATIYYAFRSTKLTKNISPFRLQKVIVKHTERADHFRRNIVTKSQTGTDDILQRRKKKDGKFDWSRFERKRNYKGEQGGSQWFTRNEIEGVKAKVRKEEGSHCVRVMENKAGRTALLRVCVHDHNYGKHYRL